MSNRPIASLVLGLSAVLVASCNTQDRDAHAYVMESLADGVGGPKALAVPGDLVMENEYFKVAITGTRHSLGPHLYGGSLIDADWKRTDPGFGKGRGNDQFNEMFATVNMNVTRVCTDAEKHVWDATAKEFVCEEGEPSESDGPKNIEIVEADGERAVVRVQGQGEPFLSLLGALWGVLQAPDMYVTTDYIVESGKPWMTMSTTVSFGVGEGGPEGEAVAAEYFDETFPLLDWALESGMVMGDFYLSGGSLDVFAPGIGFDEDGAVYKALSNGENPFNDPFAFEFIAGTADGVSYGIAPVDGIGWVPLFTASQTVLVGAARDGDGTKARFPGGSNFSYDRYFFIGHGDVGSIVDQFIEAREIPYGTVNGRVLEAHTGTPLTATDVMVLKGGTREPWSQWRTDVHPEDRNPDGSFGGKLPVGDWELLVHRQGRRDPEAVRITVKEGENVDVVLEAPRTGTLGFTVQDEAGNLIPAKVSLFRTDGKTTLTPAYGDGFIAGNPEVVVFADQGRGEVELPDGQYVAIASRGIEYELDISEPFEIQRDGGADLRFALSKAIRSDGWISADLHVHAENSHDSGVTLANRARTMACEGVEFFASTDHDYITDYGPTIERLGLEPWVQSAVGNEVTTLELGHFLGFPLAHSFTGTSGGAFDWTGAEPGDIIDSLREQGRAVGFEPVVFVGHPRDGILGYFDQYGFSPYGGTPGKGGEPGKALVERPTLSIVNPLLATEKITWDFDGIELLNSKRFEVLRTPLQTELDDFAAGEDIDIYDLLSRTVAEQKGLEQGEFRLGYGMRGVIDDWFSLNNLGFRYTAMGNSDTHGTSSTEAGCPRNFVASTTDDPGFIDDQEIADAVRDHRVVASYGPFVQLWVNDAPIGSDVEAKDGVADVKIEVQAPSWIGVDRVELYENGAMVQEWVVERTEGQPLLEQFTTQRTLDQDAWYAVIVMGDDDLGPVFSPVEIPYIELQLIITEALGGIEAVSSLLSPTPPIPREFPIRPFALTNPVWVDIGGDGFDAPGIPGWFQPPVEPE